MATTTPARRILVAIDFSSRAHGLLCYAAALAQKTAGDVSVLHVIPGPPAEDPDDAAWAAHAVTCIREQIAEAGLDPATSVHVVRGDVAAEVVRFASRPEIDLLMLAGREKPGWNGSFLGGTAATILRRARLPVLVLPALPPPAGT